MNNDSSNRLTELEKQVADLMAWKKERMAQQLTSPLDFQSKGILAKDFIQFVDSFNYVGGASGLQFPLTLIINVNNKKYYLQPTFPMYPYTAVPATDYLKLSYSPFINGDQVIVYTDDTVPGGLISGTTYYVINASGNTFQLSASSGGTAINITSVGSGHQYITYL